MYRHMRAGRRAEAWMFDSKIPLCMMLLFLVLHYDEAILIGTLLPLHKAVSRRDGATVKPLVMSFGEAIAK